MKYLVVVEKAESNYPASFRDLPGCATTGEALEETTKNMEKAVEMHLRWLGEDGVSLPVPSSKAEYLVMQKPSEVQPHTFQMLGGTCRQSGISWIGNFFRSPESSKRRAKRPEKIYV